MKLTNLHILREIGNEYKNLRNNGTSREDAVRLLQDSYQNELSSGADDDGLLFWIGLADAQYALKELSLPVSSNALAALETMEQHCGPNCPRDIDQRKKHYQAAPMEERSFFRKRRKFRCTWKLGDTFAYLLSGVNTQEIALSGKYILLRKVDELEFGDGRLLPVVVLTLWDDQPLPRTTCEYQRMPLLRLACGRMGLGQNQYEYRAEILFSSQRSQQTLSQLYLGNFSDAVMPDDEVIVRHPAKTLMILPDQLENDSVLFWKRNNSFG